MGLVFVSAGFATMTRGHQKIQSQQKNAKKQAELKKAMGHDQKTAAKAALVFTCSVCKVSMVRRGVTSAILTLSNATFKSFKNDQTEFSDTLSIVTLHVPSLQSQMPDPKTFKQHFESKHPKSPLPPELEGVEA